MRGAATVVACALVACSGSKDEAKPRPSAAEIKRQREKEREAAEAKVIAPVEPLADLLAKNPKPKTRVALELVMLPEELMQAEGGEKHRYVPGVPVGSPYLVEMGALATEAEKLLVRARKTAKHPTQRSFESMVEAIAALEEKIEKARTTMRDLAIVEIGTEGIEVELETVYSSLLGRDPHITSWPASPSFDDMNEALAKLEAERPPNPRSTMPSFGMLGANIGIFPDDPQVHRYNKLVRRYNRELARRRPALARLAALELEWTATRLRAIATRAPDRIDGRVIEPPELAEKYLVGDLDARARRLYVIEQPQGASWAARSFEHVDLVVLSDPPGAEVTVDGAPVGSTPCRAAGLPAGKAVNVTLTLDGGRSSIGRSCRRRCRRGWS